MLHVLSCVFISEICTYCNWEALRVLIFWEIKVFRLLKISLGGSASYFFFTMHLFKLKQVLLTAGSELEAMTRSKLRVSFLSARHCHPELTPQLGCFYARNCNNPSLNFYWLTWTDLTAVLIEDITVWLQYTFVCWNKTFRVILLGHM